MNNYTIEGYQQQHTPGSLAGWADEARAAAALATSICRTSFAPKPYQGKPEEATAAILKGAEIGLSPLAALSAIDVIAGKPALSAFALRALVQSHGHTIWIDSSSDKKCVAKGRRKGEDVEHTSTWTMDRATALGLTSKEQWRKQPEAMLIARATSEVARMVAADVILGIGYSVEELEDGPGLTVESVPRKARRKPAPELPAVEAPPLDAEIVDAPAPESDTPPPGDITDAQVRMMGALMREAGLTDRDAALTYVNDIISPDTVTSRKELTKAQATRVIDALKGDADAKD